MSSGEAGTSAQQPAAVQQPAAPQQAGEGGEVLAEVLVNNRSLSSRAPEVRQLQRPVPLAPGRVLVWRTGTGRPAVSPADGPCRRRRRRRRRCHATTPLPVTHPPCLGPLQEDPDLALAKMLQAQEQAWLAMAGSGALENMPGGGGGGGGGPTAAGPAGEGGAEGEELTDEEMARRLQEEEEREFQQRLLALAGIGAPGGAGSAADAGAGVEAATEYASEDEVDPDDLSYEEVGAGLPWQRRAGGARAAAGRQRRTHQRQGVPSAPGF